MKIAVIGSGYVGLVSGACFAEMGNTVTCIDTNVAKIDQLNQGILPIFEPGLAPMVLKNKEQKTLYFSHDLASAIADAAILFIAVGTPMGADGRADVQQVLAVAKAIGQSLQHNAIVVNKSTVPVGTADRVQAIIQQELDARNSEVTFEMVSNPEFLKEGAAIADFMKPDRIVIGAATPNALAVMKQLYAPFFRTHERFITMDIRSAEMTKYAANAMLATKISFMNEIANICEKVGADANQVRVGIGSDQRIGYSFIYPGAGYGGSCFPKDVKALQKIAQEHGYEANLIAAVEKVNETQKTVITQKIIQRFGEDLTGFTFGVWGLAFKPGTDDMREAPAIGIIKALVERGARVNAYDPKAMEEAKAYYLKDLQQVSYADSKYAVLQNADALVLLTEWKTFRSPDFQEIKAQLKTPIIFDGRNQYNAFQLEEKGFEYHQIGKTLSKRYDQK
ncbi:UDP-glucose dehydrogenase family protein [Polaribacter sp.]|uniref:UDP-glucose dehydrogenase family protein n=1 Tax=Polaribacter sp. TaxID=1920175 RepID=UPI003F6A254E